MAEEGHHDHGEAVYAGADVADDTLARLQTLHPTLAENLALARAWKDLDAEKRKSAATTQALVEQTPGWAPGYHADGDKCAGCLKPVEPLFTDRFENGGALHYVATLFDLPVHADAACLDALRAKVPRPSPMILDRLRRESIAVGNRPTARMANFYRHDVLAHPPFNLEDWANSVAAANPEGFERAMKKDMERTLMWVHHRVYH